MNKLLLRTLLMVLMAFSMNIMFAQVTTSGMNGKVTGANGESLPGATVIAVHVPSGTQYGTTTDISGLYRLPNMNVGGPYTLTVSYVGFENFVKEGIYLSLGQTQKINGKMAEKASSIAGVEIVAERNNLFDGNKTGAETVVNRDAIDQMPTISRGITDFTRMTPQARVTQNGGIEIAGMSNKYNAIFIDGAVNNDVFGLSETGTNGGQTGISPFSMDIIDQFNVSIAPYDVKLGGFAGAGINAVTRRGDNEFRGSAYYFFRNEGLAGKTPTDDETADRTKLPEFSSQTYGVRLGGPIIKDKLFFFANVEFQKDETPSPFDISTYGGTTDVNKLNQLITKIKSYGYNPGVYDDATKKLDGTKIFARLDWNINANHKLMFRHQYTKAEQTSPYNSSKSSLYFSNSGVFFPSTTNSSALELKSIFGNQFANNLILGATFVRDDRDPMGDNFPYVSIKDGTSYIRFGSEEFSTGNQLNQDVFSLTDNFEWYLGKHTITVGTHNEFYKTYNLFIRQNYGSYQFASIDDFINDSLATQFDRTFSLVDGKTGDGSKAAAEFNAMQLGFYLQDEWQVLDNLKVSAGIRFDVPMFLDDPTLNEQFNSQVLDSIRMEMAGEAYAPYLNAETGKAPGAQVLISPRIGFNWDVFNDQKTQVRGGVGVFTSRLPFVWPGGMYNNNGMMLGGVRYYDVAFNPDWQNQQPVYDPTKPITPSGQIDLFDKDFKYPQVLRASIAADQKLPLGFVGTVDFTYSKNLNNVMYYNFKYKKSDKTLTNGGDNRPIWEPLDVFDEGHSAAKYTNVIYGYNTNEGYAYNLTAQLQHSGWNGLSGSIAYSLGVAKSMNDGVSSQNSSQWRVPNVRGKNDLDFGISDYDMGSRIIGNLNYNLKRYGFSIGLVYNGQSGQRYGYGYADGYKNPTTKKTEYLGEDNNNLELIWVPENASQINLVDLTISGKVLTKEQQWKDLDEFIKNDKYLSTRRGQYAERNGARTPFEHIFDLHVSQDFEVKAGEKTNTIQFTFDVFNLGNLLSKDWGRRYFISSPNYGYGNYPLIAFKGFDADGTTPKFTFEKPKGEVWSIDDSGILSSRWQAQIGIRYIF
jgi:hypothetical protein